MDTGSPHESIASIAARPKKLTMAIMTGLASTVVREKKSYAHCAQSRDHAKHVVRKTREKQHPYEKNPALFIEHTRVFFRFFSADKPVDYSFAEYAAEPETNE